MRKILIITAAGLLAVACSESDMPSGEEMEADAERAMDETGEALENAGDAIQDAARDAEAEMDEMGEDMRVRDVNGRWGITEFACSEDNDIRDGVIVISRYSVDVGLDSCSIRSVDQTDGYTHFVTQCESSEGGEPYMQEFHFMADGDMLTSDNRAMDREETYVRCGDAG